MPQGSSFELPNDTISVVDLPELKKLIQEAADIVSKYINTMSQNNLGGFDALPNHKRSANPAFVSCMNRLEDWLRSQGCVSKAEFTKLSGGFKSGWSLQLSYPTQIPVVVYFLTKEEGEHRENFSVILNLKRGIQPLGMENR